ncbi:type III secretion system needle tip protein SctA [Burkholderia ambifaria]|uniref:type III secretion system needle tip protein SctA n=1 Tax=Burkholderia ambifaria TaxID=152480 RepID=UPI0024461BD3|nr:type III secretion system needle tip protein SctA [Burkholderia ambifaria]
MSSISNTIPSQFTQSNTAATQQQPFASDPEIMVPAPAMPPGATLFAQTYVREKADGLSVLLQGEKKRADALLDRQRSRTTATSPGDFVEAARVEREQAAQDFSKIAGHRTQLATPDYRAERKLATQQLVNGLRGLTATDTELTPEQRTQLQQKLKAEHTKYPPGIRAKLNDSVDKTVFENDADTPEQRTQLQQKLKAEHTKYPPGIRAKLNDSVDKTVFENDADTPEQRTQLQQKLKAEHTKYPPGIRAKLNDSVDKTVFENDAELWEKIAEYIGNIGKDYLEVHENVVGQYTEFYKAYSDILSKMGGWITPGKDGNSVKLNVTALKNELKKLHDRYSLPSTAGVLFPAKNSDGSLQGANKDKAEGWADALGLPGSCVKEFRAGSGKYAVVVDMTPINTIMRDLGGLGSADNDGNVGLDNAKFQAWQSGFKAQEENLKTTLQTLTQKYSNSNSLYDNLVKVLSSTISSCTETCKSFLQG